MHTQPQVGDRQRLVGFDHLRIWGTVGVVCIHAGADVVKQLGAVGVPLVSDFNVGNAWDSVGIFAVNCFLMISGALLLAPERTFRLAKQLRRVAVPAFFWIGVYVLANAALVRTGHEPVPGSIGGPDLSDPVGIALDAIERPPVYHLWFVYTLLALYLLTPLLRPITALAEPERRRLLLYALGLWLAVDVTIRVVTLVWADFPPLYETFVRALPHGYVAIFLLGFVVSRYSPRVPVPALVLVCVMSASVIFVLVWQEFVRGGSSRWAYSDLMVPTIVYSVAVFLLFIRLHEKRTSPSPLVMTLSLLTFRVYLVHALVLHLYRSVVPPTADLYWDLPVLGVPVVVALTLLTSFALAWAMEQVRLLRAVW